MDKKVEGYRVGKNLEAIYVSKKEDGYRADKKGEGK